jgi:hypothetical protein
MRLSHGASGRVSSKRSSAPNALTIASCAASSASSRLAVTAYAARQVSYQ